MVPGMRAAKLSGRWEFESGNHFPSEGLGSEAGLTLLEITGRGPFQAKTRSTSGTDPAAFGPIRNEKALPLS
jgi:hypothetical protein